MQSHHSSSTGCPQRLFPAPSLSLEHRWSPELPSSSRQAALPTAPRWMGGHKTPSATLPVSFIIYIPQFRRFTARLRAFPEAVSSQSLNSREVN